jgi:serine/threonine-protein kinase
VATGYVLEATEAIAEAHALGIVHRDLKPANLFLAHQPNGDPVVKVLDFGISKSTKPGEQRMTKTSAIMGSPLYMSPEQLTSARTVDSRADIWALGTVLYELLVQKTPFIADTMPELVGSILQNTHPPIREVRPDIPRELEAVIQRCLEKSPDRRFANVAELATALALFSPARGMITVPRVTRLLGSGVAARDVSSPSLPRSPSLPDPGRLAVTAALMSQSLPVEPRRRRIALLVPAVVGLAVIGISVAWVARSTKQETTAVVTLVPSMGSPPAASESAPTSEAPVGAVAPPPTGVPPLAVADATAPPSQPSAAPPAPKPSARPPSKPATHTPTCHMVSYRDADGIKRFKEECK